MPVIFYLLYDSLTAEHLLSYLGHNAGASVSPMAGWVPVDGVGSAAAVKH